MTCRINLTPEAERQLNEIDDCIAQTATADIARRFVAALLEHIDGIVHCNHDQHEPLSVPRFSWYY